MFSFIDSWLGRGGKGEPRPPSAPVFQSAGAISGQLRVGETLELSPPPSYSGKPTPNVSWRWQTRPDSSGAITTVQTNGNLLLTTSFYGLQVRYQYMAENSVGTIAWQNADWSTSVVSDAPVIGLQPSISGSGSNTVLDLGTATAADAPVANWDFFRDGVSIKTDLTVDTTTPGEYLLTVSWVNSASTVVAESVSRSVATVVNPIVPPTILTQPRIVPSTAGVGDSVTLSLGTATAGATATWDFLRNGVSIKSSVDEGYFTLEIPEGGDYTLTVSWTDAGGTTAATPATLNVAVEPEVPSINFDTQSLVYIDANTPFTGTDSAVTTILSRGTGGYVFTATGAGAAVRHTTEGFVFSDGAYVQSQVLSNQPTTDGLFAVMEVTLTSYGSAIGQLLDGSGGHIKLRNNAGQIQILGVDDTSVALQAGATIYNARMTIAGQIDDLLKVVSGISLSGADISAAHAGITNPALTRAIMGRYINGTIHRLVIGNRGEGLPWPITMAEVRSLFQQGGAVPPAPSVTTMQILPVFGQSENRSSSAPALMATLDAATDGQVYWLSGMEDMNGKAVGMNGAGSTTGTGLNTLNQEVPANGFMSAKDNGSISPAFAFQYRRAMDMDADEGVVLADHGYGGLYIRYWREDSPEAIGRNQLYWLSEVGRQADELNITLTCPYVYLWQGMSEKGTTVPVYRSDFDVAYGQDLLPAIQAQFGTTPKLVVVVNGADSNSLNDPGQVYMPDTHYRIALDYGGVIATHQRLFVTIDGNGHPTPEVKALAGETCAWAVSEVEAGNAWNIVYHITKSGAVVTVTFDLRPGETLMDRPDLFANYGGASTCLNYGFEAQGGIVSAVPNFASNSVVVTLANANATWFRFARQSQDVTGPTFLDSNGYAMSAHRSTLFGSHTKASDMLAGQTMYRPLPSFNGSFSGANFVPNDPPGVIPESPGGSERTYPATSSRVLMSGHSLIDAVRSGDGDPRPVLTTFQPSSEPASIWRWNTIPGSSMALRWGNRFGGDYSGNPPVTPHDPIDFANPYSPTVVARDMDQFDVFVITESGPFALPLNPDRFNSLWNTSAGYLDNFWNLAMDNGIAPDRFYFWTIWPGFDYLKDAEDDQALPNYLAYCKRYNRTAEEWCRKRNITILPGHRIAAEIYTRVMDGRLPNHADDGRGWYQFSYLFDTQDGSDTGDVDMIHPTYLGSIFFAVGYHRHLFGVMPADAQIQALLDVEAGHPYTLAHVKDVVAATLDYVQGEGLDLQVDTFVPPAAFYNYEVAPAAQGATVVGAYTPGQPVGAGNGFYKMLTEPAEDQYTLLEISFSDIGENTFINMLQAPAGQPWDAKFYGVTLNGEGGNYNLSFIEGNWFQNMLQPKPWNNDQRLIVEINSGPAGNRIRALNDPSKWQHAVGPRGSLAVEPDRLGCNLIWQNGAMSAMGGNFTVHRGLVYLDYPDTLTRSRLVAHFCDGIIP